MSSVKPRDGKPRIQTRPCFCNGRYTPSSVLPIQLDQTIASPFRAVALCWDLEWALEDFLHEAYNSD